MEPGFITGSNLLNEYHLIGYVLFQFAVKKRYMLERKFFKPYFYKWNFRFPFFDLGNSIFITYF